VSAAHEELHHLVDRLNNDQADALRAVALQLVVGHAGETTSPDAEASAEPRRTLSFVGLIDAEPDLAERSEEILRDEFGRRPA
jgi:hypothetical protein